jgi:hypothetical protein
LNDHPRLARETNSPIVAFLSSMMEDDDVEIPGPESLHIVHSCQSDQSEMAEDDVLNPRPAAAAAAVERDDGRFRGSSRMLVNDDDQARCCCCGIITKRRLGVTSVLAFGQGIALIATCMNAASFTLAHRFNVHTQVSGKMGDLVQSVQIELTHEALSSSFFSSFGCTYSCHFICSSGGPTKLQEECPSTTTNKPSALHLPPHSRTMPLRTNRRRPCPT